MSTGAIALTPSSVAFCNVQSMRSPRETPCTSVIASGDSGRPAIALQQSDAHRAAGDRGDLGAMLAAAPIEDREPVARHAAGGRA